MSNSIFILIAGAFFVISLLLSGSWQGIKKFLLRAMVGIGLLFIINIIGNKYGYHVVINEYTALIAGTLGTIGIFALFVLQNFIIT